jgi:lipopolysaccharide export LptBFGC system permease protein LptF
MIFQNTFLDNVAILGLFFAIIAIMYTVLKDVLISLSFTADSFPYAPTIIAFLISVVLAFACVIIVGRMSKESQN